MKNSRTKTYASNAQVSRLIKQVAKQVADLMITIVERSPDVQTAAERLRAFAGTVKEESKETNMTDTSHAPLRIEIHDPRNVAVYEGDTQLGGVQELKLHVATDRIPPIFEISVLEIVEGMSDEMSSTIQRTMEAARRCGAQLRIQPFQPMEANPDEQGQAEQALKEQLIPPGG